MAADEEGGDQAGNDTVLTDDDFGDLLAQGDEPPVKELIDALGRARALDFAGAQSLAQEFFGARDQAAENFELIARLLEEMLCFKLLGSELIAPAKAVKVTSHQTGG